MFSRLASRLRPLAPPALGGLLLALSFPPFGLFLVAFVALTPLLVCVRRLGFWGGFRKGYLFGLVFGLINLFWLEQFVSRWTGSVWMGALPWVLVSAAYAVYFGLFAGAAAHAWARGWPWAIPLIWAGVEVFRSTIPYLYFPWAILGTALYKAPVLLQPAWWGGAYLLSAWVALFSVLAALLWTGEPVRKTWAYGLALLAILAGSLVSFLGEREGESRVVVAVQPGVDLAFPPREEVNRLLAERMPEAMAIGSASHRDLVVLPEGVGRGWDEGAPVTAFELDTSVPLLLGAHRDAPGGPYQSVFAYDGKWQYADKTRLVIFGEYVPFRDRLGFLGGFNLPAGDLQPGSEVTTLEVGGIRVGSLLCFEALFEEVAREHAANGAELLAVMSLDDWYQRTGAIEMLKAAAVLRAVENRLPVVRSAPLGPSLIVDERGRILAEAAVGETTAVRAEVTLAPSRPFRLRYVFPWLALGVWLLFTLWRRAPTNASS